MALAKDLCVVQATETYGREHYQVPPLFISEEEGGQQEK